jgi:hypothetical protein
VYRLCAVPDRPTIKALHVDEAVSGFVQEFNVRLKLRRAKLLESGMGEKACRRRSIKANALDLHWNDGLALQALQEARRQRCGYSLKTGV